MAHRMLLYDIPDAYRPVRDWLDELSNEDFLAHITMVQKFGPVFSGCELLANDLWALRVPIGYGNVANLVFLSLNTRDYLALYGFISKRGQSSEAEMGIANIRRRDLE
ncbi:hypothetical protein [Sphingomonas sp.]|uniref:hypothetical protein n=1 Tax=Sphingomonas sp. TaxID=28214 RepID=UPI002FC67600